jgi:hypothetical protein
LKEIEGEMKRLPGAMTLLAFAMLLTGAVSADTFLAASVVDYGDNFRGDTDEQVNLIMSYQF